VEQDGIQALNCDRDALERKLGSRLSLEIDAILWPSSEKKAIDDSFNGPSVSAAIG